MLFSDVCFNPCHKVVFECSLDELMKDIRGQCFMYVGVGKVGCKRLIENKGSEKVDENDIWHIP